eukprot:TRINITY_DN67974_c6_g11_i1.p1 TRINITY_DN67974_c6_g11~~TRINITY_DN67974_c6_g11_i1.p1  ORF type:complete len:934 (+),score=110.33 TRINITY_DN67974_c6_g11_i1:215-2803(+)
MLAYTYEGAQRTLRKKGGESGMTKFSTHLEIMITLVQLLALVVSTFPSGSTSVKWFSDSFKTVAEAFNFQFKGDPVALFTAGLSFGVAFGVVLLLLSIRAILLPRAVKTQFTADPLSVMGWVDLFSTAWKFAKWGWMPILILIMSLCYIPISHRAMMVLDCSGIFAAAIHAKYPNVPCREEQGIAHDDDLREGVSAITWVCTCSEWSKYNGIRVLAIAVLVLYTAAFPAFCFFITNRFKPRGSAEAGNKRHNADGNLVAYSDEMYLQDLSSRANKHNPFLFLYEEYERKWSAWKAYVNLFRLSLAAVQVFLWRWPHAHAWVTISLFGIWGGILYISTPYLDDSADIQELGGCILTIFITLFAYISFVVGGSSVNELFAIFVAVLVVVNLIWNLLFMVLRMKMVALLKKITKTLEFIDTTTGQRGLRRKVFKLWDFHLEAKHRVWHPFWIAMAMTTANPFRAAQMVRLMRVAEKFGRFIIQKHWEECTPEDVQVREGIQELVRNKTTSIYIDGSDATIVDVMLYPFSVTLRVGLRKRLRVMREPGELYEVYEALQNAPAGSPDKAALNVQAALPAQFDAHQTLEASMSSAYWFLVFDNFAASPEFIDEYFQTYENGYFTNLTGIAPAILGHFGVGDGARADIQQALDFLYTRTAWVSQHPCCAIWFTIMHDVWKENMGKFSRAKRLKNTPWMWDQTEPQALYYTPMARAEFEQFIAEHKLKKYFSNGMLNQMYSVMAEEEAAFDNNPDLWVNRWVSNVENWDELPTPPGNHNFISPAMHVATGMGGRLGRAGFRYFNNKRERRRQRNVDYPPPDDEEHPMPGYGLTAPEQRVMDQYGGIPDMMMHQGGGYGYAEPYNPGGMYY